MRCTRAPLHMDPAIPADLEGAAWKRSGESAAEKPAVHIPGIRAVSEEANVCDIEADKMEEPFATLATSRRSRRGPST